MNWKNKTLLLGAIAGIAFGLASAYLIIQRAERDNTLPAVSPGDGVKVGLGLLGVMRLIADIGNEG